jgi:hypothetical protein
VKIKGQPLQYWRGYAAGWLRTHRHYLNLQYWRGRFSR